MSSFSRRHVLGLALAAAFAAATPAFAEDAAPNAKARWLVQQLAALDVESKWPAGVHIDWRSGVPDGQPETSNGRHTHCSAFVAAAADALGVYILRPPEHGQILLANAQYEWLADEGRAQGWRPLDDMYKAQEAANRGDLVVASYRSHRPDKPGHIAIVLPSTKSAAELAAVGPNVTMAGTFNSASVSVKDGFAGHPAAWDNNEIAYYAHEVRGP